MQIHILQTTAELEDYDTWVRGHPQGNLWQSLEWANYQRALGKEVRIYGAGRNERVAGSVFEATALVTIDRTIGGFSVWDIPRGPLISHKSQVTSQEYCEEFLEKIIADAKKDKCLALYFSASSSLVTSDFRLSTRHIHPQTTRIIDLTKSEEEILAGMHPKGRYNISLAKKHGIEITDQKSEVDAFYDLLQHTGNRDGFKISQKSHYARFLSDLDSSLLLLATHQGKPIGGLMGVMWNKTAIYYYGASSYEYRNLMGPYLLQWEAMKRAKAHGCTRYDLLGISPANAGPGDPWWGITDFKRKFGGEVVAHPPEQEVVVRPMVKMVLEMKRKVMG